MLKLTMKYVTKTKAGAYKYRRVIPVRWRPKFGGRREFVRTIGHSAEEAIKAYDKVHRHYQKIFDALKPYEAVMGKPTYSQTRTALQAFNTETFRLTDGNKQRDWQDGEEVARAMMADDIRDSYDRNPVTGEYEDMPAHDEALIKALYAGLDKAALTIEDAFEFYLKEKKEETPDREHKQKVRFERVKSYLMDVVGPDRAIVSITRDDARKLRDEMLGNGQKPATVMRYFDDIKAVLSFATREREIPYSDPFRALEMPRTTVDKELRSPLPDHVIAAVEENLGKREDQILFQLWTILKYTGARLSEITMLRVDEVHLATNMPYLEIKPRLGHPLKTKHSKRELPLTKTPLVAVKARLDIARGDEHLFEKFIDLNGASNASARLSKAIRKVSKNKLHTAHSLRHNFRDRGREKIPENLEVRNAIEGRAYSAGEGARYGSMKLEWLYEAMVKINGET